MTFDRIAVTLVGGLLIAFSAWFFFPRGARKP
jgi:hypothetical protein